MTQAEGSWGVLDLSGQTGLHFRSVVWVKFFPSIADRRKDAGGAMNQLRGFVGRFLRDDRGQSTTEYILILSVVVLVAMKFKQTFQSKLTGIVENLGNQIEGGMQDR